MLRLRPGDEITISDGAGGWRRCRWGPRIDPDGPIERDARPEPPLTVGFALTKGERPEWAVQKLTELGIDAIVPFVAERSVVRWDPDKAAANVGRLRRVAREAAMQSRRVWLPDVEPVAPFAAVVARPGVALADRDGHAPSLAQRTLLIGPEGGWAPAERESAVRIVGLGPLVLRAETAAVAGGVLLAALRAGIVRVQPES